MAKFDFDGVLELGVVVGVIDFYSAFEVVGDFETKFVLDGSAYLSEFGLFDLTDHLLPILDKSSALFPSWGIEQVVVLGIYGNGNRIVLKDHVEGFVCGLPGLPFNKDVV